ncbi:MAG: hypothetical protein ACKO96_00585, partial [Flammeovirgaceae bacterium]
SSTEWSRSDDGQKSQNKSQKGTMFFLNPEEIQIEETQQRRKAIKFERREASWALWYGITYWALWYGITY